ncbi:MAG: TetR/AcrR family transcriptional regulator [Acidimicrobiales bacterium]
MRICFYSIKATLSQPGVLDRAFKCYGALLAAELLLPSGRSTRRLLKQPTRVPTVVFRGPHDPMSVEKWFADSPALFREGCRVIDLAIVAAARECFQRWGLARTRMDDIAQRVGIVRPNLYRYFPSKEAVAAAVSAEESQRINDIRRERLPMRGPVGDLIAQSILLGLSLAQEDEYILDLLRLENRELVPETLATASIRYQYWRPIFDHGRSRVNFVPTSPTKTSCAGSVPSSSISSRTPPSTPRSTTSTGTSACS